MVTVNLWSSLTRFTDGERAVEVEANTVAKALKMVTEAHPGLGPIFEAGISVVLEGEMVTNMHTPIEPGAEIFLLQQIKGG